MSKHARKLTPEQQLQQDRLTAVREDASALRDLIPQLRRALVPGTAPAGEKLGKRGKRAASPLNLNADAHDQLVLIQVGVVDLTTRCRQLLGDDQRAADAVARRVNMYVTAGVQFLGPHRTPQRIALLYREATRIGWRATAGVWEPSADVVGIRAGRLDARRLTPSTDAERELRALPHLVDRLHHSNDEQALQLVQRIARELADWTYDAQNLLGLLDKETIELERRCPDGDCGGRIRVNRSTGIARCTNRQWHYATGLAGRWDDQTWRQIVQQDGQETA